MTDTSRDLRVITVLMIFYRQMMKSLDVDIVFIVRNKKSLAIIIKSHSQKLLDVSFHCYIWRRRVFLGRDCKTERNLRSSSCLSASWLQSVSDQETFAYFTENPRREAEWTKRKSISTVGREKRANTLRSSFFLLSQLLRLLCQMTLPWNLSFSERSWDTG